MSLLWEIQCFLKASGMTASRFGAEAVNDRNLVRTLRNGREPGTRMIRRVMAFIADHRTRL